MKDYSGEVRELKNYLEKQVELIRKQPDAGGNWDICSEMQQRMIALGTMLEDECHLKDARIIKCLELCCELCYQFPVGNFKMAEFDRYMSFLLFNMEYEYYWSTPPDAHEFSIAAIIKNERDIIEWIEYHLLVGVDHFYIYDNESTDGVKDKLQKYMDEGIVTYIYFPGKYQQFAAYNHAIEHFKYETKWLAVIDADEYLIPVEEGKKLPQVVDEIEKHFLDHPMRNICYVGAIAANWRAYGTSGHKEACDGLVIENYKYRGEDDYFQNVHIKSIYNPRTVIQINNPHYGHLVQDYICISENGSYIPTAYFYDSHCQKLRINHYFSKSEEELIAKNRRGWPDHDLHRDDEKELYEAGVNCNKVYDPIMDRYIREVKERIKS